VNYPTAGPHRLAAGLDADAVRTDNSRYWAANLPDSIPVLLIDGAREARDAFFLAAALAPGGKSATGVRPLIESPQFLRRHDRLSEFAVIYLLNIPWRDVGDAEIAALEKYVAEGGGVAFVLGELTNAQFITENLYREGEGMFPAPIERSTDLVVDRLQRSPDLEVTDHPMFSVFAGERNSFISTVMVQRYFSVASGWIPAAGSGVKVIARLRNGAPFCLEKKFGDGKVIALLSKVSPEETNQGVWNNWGRNNPSFVVAMLEMQSYLAGSVRADQLLEVGAPLAIHLDPMVHSPAVHIATPAEAEGEVLIDASQGGDGRMTATLTETKASGFYEVTLTDTSGGTSQLIFASNPPPEEGDLRLISPDQLRSRLEGIDVSVIRAEEVRLDELNLAGVNLGDSILYILLALLIGEQLLAYSASYHPPKSGGAR
jgi:hypothetical protein